MAQQTQSNQNQVFPPQHQNYQPGSEARMNPRPVDVDTQYKASNKLQGKVAVITGGDSGIGRAVAIAYAKEGADVVIIYLMENRDAQDTKQMVEEQGRRCLLISGDLGDEAFCRQAVDKIIKEHDKIDILVNNAAEQHVQNGLENIPSNQLEKTFRTNVFSLFYLTQAALPHMKQGSSIINTSSITAFDGDEQLIDYSASKGAVVAFTRSLSQSLVGKGIRVNTVAPGPVWTPLIPSSFSAQHVATFGADTPMGRPAQPFEIAPSYVFLASDDSAFITGQVLHINGGTVIN